jgi:hypothetical protein
MLLYHLIIRCYTDETSILPGHGSSPKKEVLSIVEPDVIDVLVRSFTTYSAFGSLSSVKSRFTGFPGRVIRSEFVRVFLRYGRHIVLVKTKLLLMVGNAALPQVCLGFCDPGWLGSQEIGTVADSAM